MKLDQPKEWFEKSAKIEGDACVSAGLLSAPAPSEPTSPAPVVVTGSWLGAMQLRLRGKIARLLVAAAFRLHHDSAKAHVRRKIGTQEFLKMRINAHRRARWLNGHTVRYNPEL